MNTEGSIYIKGFWFIRREDGGVGVVYQSNGIEVEASLSPEEWVSVISAVR